MSGTDRTIVCADCSQEFVFTARDQAFYAERGFSPPLRCPDCRAARKAARGDSGGGGSSYGSSSGYRDRGPREMFTATCSRCGREAQVPFRPTSGKPVYCNDCFASMRR